MELQENQAALILTADEDGEVTVDVSSSNHQGLPGSICQVIAKRLTEDEIFQAEIMAAIERG